MLSAALAGLLAEPTRHLFFTGKGGVGKTSLACATAIALADRGRRVLLVSTDPASNLDEVLGVRLGGAPTSVPSVGQLEALNVDPEAAALAYRERVVGPYRGRLPQSAVTSIEEQLSGACTVEIAAFDEFAKLLGDESTTARFDHVVFDTAPTGHTLRLLSLPAAWSGYLRSNPGAVSCLGPLGGLQAQKSLYEAAVRALTDASRTTLVLVARPERATLGEAERTHGELAAMGVRNQRLVINGVFQASDASDETARALEARGRGVLDDLPAGIAALPRVLVPLWPATFVGIDAFRLALRGETPPPRAPSTRPSQLPNAGELLEDLAQAGRGVIMTMGKGGVGKTTLAAMIAIELARRGHRVHLTTTDPAAHVDSAVGVAPANLRVTRIDPATETAAYVDEVSALAGPALDDAGRALLQEDLKSPCTEEIAVFRAFARTIAEGEDGFVVVDTAPTGHTLLLLDATETYHREVSRGMGDVPDAVRRLLPRLRDPRFTRILIVTLPDATPVHEAMRLQDDLRRAEITPYAWIVNQSIAASGTSDPMLAERAAQESAYLDEVLRVAPRVAVEPWTDRRLA
jgi:arsenite-transporting ATPase